MSILLSLIKNISQKNIKDGGMYKKYFNTIFSKTISDINFHRNLPLKYIPIKINVYEDIVKINFTMSNYPINSIKPILDKPTINIPVTPYINKIPLLELPLNNSVMECPTQNNDENYEKQAVRLIVIRRIKMNKHRRKKLRKRDKFLIRKVEQKRATRKEKIFQNYLLRKMTKAENFSPVNYIIANLKAANRKPIPKFWKGKRLPKFIVRQLMGIDPKINYKNIQQTQD